MPPTIYDIADRADVSTATVSRVLNDTATVAAETRDRVLEAAQALGYQPHASAQNLARQQTNTIGVVVPLLANYFYMGVLRGIQDSLGDMKYDLLVYTPSHPDEIAEQIRRASQRGRSDGFLVLSAPIDSEIAECLETSDQEVVLVDTKHPDFESVYVDNRTGGYKATRHLIEAGYERIGHITSGTPEPSPATERREGYEKALHEEDHAQSTPLIARGDAEPFAFAKEGGYRAMKSLLDRTHPPDAVFAASDMQAIGALQAAEEEKVEVPDEVALLGFDDLDISQYVGLSTLRQPLNQYGQLAVDKLTTRIESASQSVSRTVFNPEIIVRRTCGTAGTTEAGTAR